MQLINPWNQVQERAHLPKYETLARYLHLRSGTNVGELEWLHLLQHD